jgi:hypothetical protein
MGKMIMYGDLGKTREDIPGVLRKTTTTITRIIIATADIHSGYLMNTSELHYHISQPTLSIK